MLLFTSCKLHQPDFFVPMADFENTDDLVIESNGTNGTLIINSNTYWVAESSMEWLTLSKTNGSESDEINYSITPTKVARRAEITLYPAEIPGRVSKITVRQSGVYEISKVGKPDVTNTVSITGETATITASFDGYSLTDDSNIRGWFLISSESSNERRVDAIVNNEFKTIYATVDDLTPETEYTVVSYVQLDEMNPVYSEATTFKTELVPPRIEAVAETIASELVSKTGKTAKLYSSFTGISLTSVDMVNAGFAISATGIESTIVDVKVSLTDMTRGSLSAELDDLEAGVEYTVYAWVKVNDNQAVNGEMTTFKTEISTAEPIELVADFTSNEIWKLPSDAEMENKEVTVTDDKGYVWKFSGCAISSGSLWTACQAKKGYQGYVILPKFDGLSVKYISFPNNGSGASGKAAVSIYVSEDNGNTYKPLFSNIKLGTQSEFELTGQKPGSLYKIINDNGPDGNNGYTKTKQITIKAE